MGAPALEAPATAGGDGTRSPNRSEYPLSIGRQLPAWSPLSLGAIGAGLFAGGSSASASLSARIRAEYGCRDVALLDSGTSALALACRGGAANGQRARVALPAYGCFDLMTAADTIDAEVVLYDLDPTTLAPDPDSLARVTAGGIDAVVVAHWYGVPADLGPALEIAGRTGALVIEDAAQAVGTSLAGRPAGSAGDFGVLSFGRGKGRTGGHGGALLANSPRAAALLGGLTESLPEAGGGARNLAALLAQWMMGRPSLYGIPAAIPSLRLGETVYRTAQSPSRILPASAAVVGAVWEASGREADSRRDNAAHWIQILDAVEDLDYYRIAAGATCGWLRFPVRAWATSRAILADPRSRSQGVMPGYPSLLSALPVGPTRLRASHERHPGAVELCRSLFTVPTHSLLRPHNMRSITRTLETRGADFTT